MNLLAFSEDRPVHVVEVELQMGDDLYYVSEEAGDRFGTKPYILHTALYYAFGFFPTRFRTKADNPVYKKHRDDSRIGRNAYIHPATSLSVNGYETRHFAVKSEAHRVREEPPSRNMRETGYQKTIRPGTTFRTFITTDDEELAEEIESRIPANIRVGKKMSTARVRTTRHTEIEENGVFELGQPISLHDINTETYSLEGQIRWEKFPNLDLVRAAKLSGPYITVDPHYTDDSLNKVAIPTQTGFLKHD